MTVKVVGAWEFGWSTPIMEYDLWHFTMRDFAVDQWIMTPISGITQQNITERFNIPNVVSNNPTLTPIYVDENGEADLEVFVHPADCLYIFGKASYSPWVAAGSPANSSVKIVTPLQAGLLWPHQAAGIVLYDRLIKSA